MGWLAIGNRINVEHMAPLIPSAATQDLVALAAEINAELVRRHPRSIPNSAELSREWAARELEDETLDDAA